MDITQKLDAIGRAELAGPVQRALGSGPVEIADWSYEPLAYAHFNPASGGLYRFSGTVQDRGATVPWSMVLKVSNKPEKEGVQSSPSHTPASWNYWKREFLLYDSGLLDELPGDLRAPACFGCEAQGEDSTWLWLEDVPEAHGSPWSPALYALAARHLGQFNGAYLAGRPLPDRGWLSRNWLAGWVQSWGPFVEELPAALDHPYVRHGFSERTARRLTGLWAEHEGMLVALEGLPHTLCHLDAHRQNLMIAPGPGGCDQTMAVDWAFTGLAPVGADLCCIVTWSAVLAGRTSELSHLADAVFWGYLAGLDEAGWRGDVAPVRLGYAACEALRMGFLLGAYWRVAMRPGIEPWVRDYFGCTVEELMDRVADALHYLLDLADEARDLMGDLG